MKMLAFASAALLLAVAAVAATTSYLSRTVTAGPPVAAAVSHP